MYARRAKRIAQDRTETCIVTVSRSDEGKELAEERSNVSSEDAGIWTIWTDVRGSRE